MEVRFVVVLLFSEAPAFDPAISNVAAFNNINSSRGRNAAHSLETVWERKTTTVLVVLL